MNATTPKMLVMFLCFTMLMGGCSNALESGGAPTQSSTIETDFDPERGDAPSTWKAKAEGLTLWVDTVIGPSESRGKQFYTMRGRVSKNLNGLRAYDESGYHFAARTVSARKFEVTLDQRDLLRLLGGPRVYLDFFAESGSTAIYHGMVRFAPRLGSFSGTSSIFVHRAVNPVLVGGELKFRGRIKTAKGYEMDLVYTDDDAGPSMTAEGPRSYRFDWSPAELMLASDTADDPIYFRGADTASTPVEKLAHLEFRLIQLGVGTEGPMQAWPREICDAEVGRCLAELDHGDTEECGYAQQVHVCGEHAPPVRRADTAVFAEDLADAIRAHYADHAADIVAGNGRTLAAALRQVDQTRAGIVPFDEVDGLGYDPDHHDAFFHPDPIFRDSPTVWYGVYDHASQLVSTFTVN